MGVLEMRSKQDEQGVEALAGAAPEVAAEWAVGGGF